MNIHQALKNSYSLLNNRFNTYKLDCEILLANTLKMNNRLDLFINLEKNLTKKEINIFFIIYLIHYQYLLNLMELKLY